MWSGPKAPAPKFLLALAASLASATNGDDDVSTSGLPCGEHGRRCRKGQYCARLDTPDAESPLDAYVCVDDAVTVGRPFHVDGEVVIASSEFTTGWFRPQEQLAPAMPTSTDERRHLAERWAAFAAAEHASVASFSLHSLHMLSVGAPAALIASIHRAALEEVEHAKLGYGLASAFNGTSVGPAPLPTAGATTASDLLSIAAATAREGCFGETVGAVEARLAAARATDPAVRAALTVVAADEARHAALAWETVAWIGSRSPEAAGHVHSEISALAHLGIPTAAAWNAAREGRLERWGVLGDAAKEHARRAALEQVIWPALGWVLESKAGVETLVARAIGDVAVAVSVPPPAGTEGSSTAS